MLTFEEYLIEKDLSVDEARTILGLPISFSQDELKSAYHSAAKKSHPDAGGNAEIMSHVNAAYSKLKSIGPEPFVSSSTTSAQAVAASNNPDERFKQERMKRRKELLAKQKK
jgi:hypothetical protein